jgi:hypothetical protein
MRTPAYVPCTKLDFPYIGDGFGEGMFMNARRSEGTRAGACGYVPFLEVGEECVPSFAAWSSVFMDRALAAGCSETADMAAVTSS